MATLDWQHHGGHHYTAADDELLLEVQGGLGLPTKPICCIRVLDNQGKQLRIKRCEVSGRAAAFEEAVAIAAEARASRAKKEAKRKAALEARASAEAAKA